MASNSGSEMQSRDDGGTQDKQPTDWILCYLTCPKDASGSFLGAILLTYNRTRPQHFGFLRPVKPTTMQRLLYGSTLDEYIKIDVIAQRLWQGLPNPPDVLFVDAADLILARRVTGVPTAFITKAPPSEADTSSLSIVRYDVGPHKNDDPRVGEIVVGLESTCDLIEPFTRMREALKEGLKPGT